MQNENLSYYHIFYEVASTQNLSRAARNLYISQPAVSKAIQKLEENLKTSLFLRSSKGVTLTPEGKVLYEHVKTAFLSLVNGEEELRSMRSFDAGHIRIGVSTTLCKYVLLPYLQAFIQNYPQIKVSIFCQSSNETLELLAENQIDFGLIGEPPHKKGVFFHPSAKIQDTFVCAKKYIRHLLPITPDFNQKVFQHCTLLLLDKNNMSRQFIDNYFTENQILPSHLLEITTMDLLIDFAKIGVGVACVIRSFIQDELEMGQLIEIPLPIPIPSRKIGFVYSRENALSLAAQQFLSMSGIEALSPSDTVHPTNRF